MKTKMTRAEKKIYDLLETEIDRVYRESCQNIQVDMMDIGKIFLVGHQAIEENKDLRQAIVDFVQTIRKN